MCLVYKKQTKKLCDVMECLSLQTKEIFDFITDTFSDMPEYLFLDSDTAVFRKGTRKKWYAVVMTIPKRKLGINSDEMIEVLNIKLSPNDVALLVDHKGFFPAYHMNKKHWCTIVLANIVDTNYICYLIEQSYNLVKG